MAGKGSHLSHSFNCDFGSGVEGVQTKIRIRAKQGFICALTGQDTKNTDEVTGPEASKKHHWIGTNHYTLSGVAHWTIQVATHPLQDNRHLHMNEIPQMPTRAIINGSYKHTTTLTPFPPLWTVGAAHRCHSHNYIAPKTLIWGKKPKDFAVVCHLGFLFAFFHLNFVAIDIGDMSPTYGG